MTGKTFTEPQTVLDNQRKRILASSRPQPCGAGVGRGLTCGKYPASLYPRGRRCADCATAEGLVVGRAPGAYPELLQERRAAGQYRTTSLPTIIDVKAEASGKRDPNRKQRRDNDAITERFLAFHQTNPHVHTRLIELITEAVLQGATRIGVGALFERLRYAERTETNGDRYALNNDYRAPYVRLITAEHPEWAGLFETRQRRSA